MFKNSVAYRRFCYYRHRRAGKLNIYIRLAAAFILIGLFVSYAQNHMFPYLIDISQNKARSDVTVIINQAISKELDNIDYEDIVKLTRDESGNITSVQVNTARLNSLGVNIAGYVQGELMENKVHTASIPFGVLLGSPIFSGLGPDIKVKYNLAGNVETSFESEFTSCGINQTRHRILLRTKIKIGLAVPLVNDKTDLIISTPIAETIIVGDVPQAYYDN